MNVNWFESVTKGPFLLTTTFLFCRGFLRRADDGNGNDKRSEEKKKKENRREKCEKSKTSNGDCGT
ncbi:hypothetical protein RUM44_008958 [Polyplax serrata]|uniref:Uncharacterized protein n=1 Tax=Polyplax serrata TaxID=468196 RepID=A0ABR1ARB7_POLSC